MEYGFPLVTAHEIGKIFQDINLTKAPGPDGLCANIIYEFFKVNKEKFTNMMNECINYAIFPVSWKQASVALIPKVGKDLSSPSAYRPICLLSTWGKVLDKILSRRLTFEPEKTGKLHPNQFGFRNGRSTLDALQFFKDFVHSSKLNKHVTIAISLDMSNAFNSVEWRDVISALHEDGVSDYLIFSISDFLNNRKIVDPNLQVNYNYGKGVPQGSCLGPILWLLIADRLLRAMDQIKNCVVTMFADDILLLASDTASYKFSNSLVNPLREIELWAHKFNLKINPIKSKFIIFPFAKRVTHIPRLKICGKNIRNCSEFKYLGLSFDERLNWFSHFNSVKGRVSGIQYKIKRLSRATWGACPEVLKEIYLRAVEKFILYGAPIWFSENVKLRNKILQIQRIPLLGISKTYRTVSTDALHILCGCPPLDLVAKNDFILFKLFGRHCPIQVGDQTISFDDVTHLHSDPDPPWNVISFPWAIGDPDNQIGLKIFTDGSKLNNKVGFGIACFDERDEHLWSVSERLNDEASVFIAEAMAIFYAIDKCKDYSCQINIYTDSRSVLMAINSLKDDHPIIFQIKNLLRKSDHVKLFWVKAHVGTYGNEFADSLAKRATERDDIDHVVPMPKSSIKYKMRESLIKDWQDRWKFSRNARFLFGIFPEVSFRHCFGDFYINQILTTHGSFPIHQSRFFGKSSLCICGLDEGTVSHFIYGCPRFSSIREKFFPVNFSVLGFLDLILNKRACQGLREIVSLLLCASLA
ncbi:Putative protein in type-1 retrotransposable element R1DM [Araneus ventricosus]|uniref:Retrovirus-related Pol polyprotein from type-1 retrotransposable element R1 n=1 Tax=Araneus ventricosus TaxID=182803 RepID=A0A4Y2WBN9_ARAVE|nr:Putative protein in type-1 retrotransposable element R1DM [Araneus ventricosus]